MTNTQVLTAASFPDDELARVTLVFTGELARVTQVLDYAQPRVTQVLGDARPRVTEVLGDIHPRASQLPGNIAVETHPRHDQLRELIKALGDPDHSGYAGAVAALVA